MNKFTFLLAIFVVIGVVSAIRMKNRQGGTGDSCCQQMADDISYIRKAIEK